MSFVLWFNECSKDVLHRVGGKCSSLGALMRAGARVPDGFALTTDAWRAMLEQNGLQAQIQSELGRIQSGSDPALADISLRIRTLVLETPLPRDIESDCLHALRELSARAGGGALPVAVRSSATAEDLPSASFAGLHDTALWIIHPDDVLQKVRHCWSSLYTARAIAYRIDNGFAHDKTFMAVGVQKMVHAKAAGVAFSLNPTNGDRSKIAIDSNFGLGEAVVSGEVTPDHFLVDKVILEVVRQVISQKRIEHVFDPSLGRVVESVLSPARSGAPSLCPAEIVTVAKMAKWAEAHFGSPQDVEWALDANAPMDEAAVFLQSRPETVWSRRQSAQVTTANSRGMAGLVSTLIHGIKLETKR